MFIPLKIGPLTVHSNIVQGPLAGYSCAPFRVLTWRYGKPGFCTTEMISAKDLVNRKKIPRRYIGKDVDEGPLCYQFAANNPDDLARATLIANQYGADIIDLNCGCPVKKIRAKNIGSALLTQPEIIYALVKAMKQNTDAAVSIKIRVPVMVNDHNNKLVVDAAESAGVDFITVHGRHWQQRYDAPCQFDEIAAVVNIANVPVVANGDAEDVDSILALFKQTRCAGIMIARASVGRPWLFEQLRCQLLKLPFTQPSIKQTADIFIEHIERLQALESEKLAVLQSRKLAKYYARELTNKTEFVIAMQQVSQKKEAVNIIRTFMVNN